MNTGEHSNAKSRVQHAQGKSASITTSQNLQCARSGGVAAQDSLSALLGENVNQFAEEDAAGPTGGYPWSCGGEGAISKSVEPLLQSL